MRATFLNMAQSRGNHELQLFFIVSAIFWCMCLLQILGIYVFNKYRLRRLPIIEKRYPRLVMMEAVVSCVMLGIIYPAYFSVIVTVVLGYPDIAGPWWSCLWTVTVEFTMQIAPVIETCRIWLISYDLQYLHSSKNQQWKTEIDVSYAEKDWYLRNRGKWGSKQYVIRLGFVYYIAASTAVFT